MGRGYWGDVGTSHDTSTGQSPAHNTPNPNPHTECYTRVRVSLVPRLSRVSFPGLHPGEPGNETRESLGTRLGAGGVTTNIVQA